MLSFSSLTSSNITRAAGCFALLLVVIYGSRLLERKWPIADVPDSEFRDDWLAFIVSVGLESAFGPITTAIAGTIATLTGLGWAGLSYRLKVTGGTPLSHFSWSRWICTSTPLHRLQHAIPFLWSMHSFHHSANALTLITGGRHFWLERVLVNAFLPILAILFSVPADMAFAVGIIFFVPDACAHLDVRIPLGRFVTWINNPQ